MIEESTVMGDYASFEDLTSPYDEDVDRDVVLASGKKVRVRGLSRYEWFLAGKDTVGDGNAFEVNLLVMGVETPKLSAKQVQAWRKLPGGMNDIGAVSDRIRRLTGVNDDADKSDVPEVGEPS